MSGRLRAVACGAAAILAVAGCARGTDSTPTSAAPTSAPTTTTASATEKPAAQPLGPTVLTPVVGSVLAPPIAVPATDGKVHLAYELQLTNPLDQEVTLDAVSAMAGDRTLLNLTGDGLAHWTRILGTPTPTTRIGPGQVAVVWLDVAIDEPANIPTQITHKLDLTLLKPQPPLLPPKMTETIAPTTVDSRKPVAIAPPLSGAGWLDGGGCCDTSAHRTAIQPLNGQFWVPERFAIDFVQLNAQGKMFIGDRTKIDSYPYISSDVRAVADGPVVAVIDNLPQQVPGQSPTGLPLDQYAGNHIVQDIGDGNYAMYAHLATGSARVKPGDQLHTGQSIAALGNSGNTDAPHLHFQVMSTPEPLRSNGLPFVFDSFRIDGRLASQDGLFQLGANGGPAPTQPGFAASDESDVMPLDLDIMTFAAG